jgi:hypothetical protein
VVEVAWTAIGRLAATLAGSLFWLGSRIDGLGSRIDGLEDRLDGVNLRLDALHARLDAHIRGAAHG